MTMESKLTKVAPDDHERCQADFAGGQCRYKRIPRTLYCMLHSGNSTNEINVELRRKSMYRLGKWGQRVEELSGEEALKSLNEEVGILRMTLEEILRKCQEPWDIVIHVPQIGQIVSQIEKLVTSQIKIQEKAGLTLDKSAIMSFADQIIQILQEHLEDKDELAIVATKISDAMLTAGKLTVIPD